METKIKVIIAGGRDFNDYDRLEGEVFRILLELNMKYGNGLDIDNIDKSQFEIVSGCNKGTKDTEGADRLGEKFADNYGIKKKLFRAKWTQYGKSAGPRRNAEMAEYAVDDAVGVLIAFWDGKSKGTKSMIDLAKRYGLNEIYVARY